AWLIRTDAQGDTLWTRTYGGSHEDIGTSVQQTADGGFVMTGWTGFGFIEFVGTPLDADVWLIRTDAQGNGGWTRTYGGSAPDFGYSVQQTADGGFVIAGATRSYGAGSDDVWLIKTNSQGNIVPLSVSHQRPGLPDGFMLHPAYPNPFNPVSTIRYDLPRVSDVSLVVYDLLGRVVARLIDRQMEPGYHRAIWDGRDQGGREVPSGIYIARLVTPGYTKSIKMVLLK
ncbi:MAG: T9SS type A sorting domain-containing protein, partial [Candidatus Marinimicrobia bacterium]|nr:T9SS type A sorting domain-containing protein [Candidatus Neomarinimicrobiota bacterium]